MGKLRAKLSYANVVATIGLVIALGLGTAWAAVELEKNDVRSKHIKNGGVKTKDLANNAVTSPKVANGSLLGEDFAAGGLPQGPQGPEGPQGQQGVQGPPGLSGLEHVTATSDLQDSESGKSTAAFCPGTKKLVGMSADLGGTYFSSSFPNAEAEVTVTDIQPTGDPTTPTGVGVTAVEDEPGFAGNWQVTAHAICANVSS